MGLDITDSSQRICIYIIHSLVKLFLGLVVFDGLVSWAWICSMGLDYRHFPDNLYIPIAHSLVGTHVCWAWICSIGWIIDISQRICMYIHSFCGKVVADASWAWLCSMDLLTGLGCMYTMGWIMYILLYKHAPLLLIRC